MRGFDGEFISQPYTDDELVAIRRRLDDGDIPGVEKYATIQRLIDSHMLANHLKRVAADKAKQNDDALETIGDVLRNYVSKAKGDVDA